MGRKTMRLKRVKRKTMRRKSMRLKHKRVTRKTQKRKRNKRNKRIRGGGGKLRPDLKVLLNGQHTTYPQWMKWPDVENFHKFVTTETEMVDFFNASELVQRSIINNHQDTYNTKLDSGAEIYRETVRAKPRTIGDSQTSPPLSSRPSMLSNSSSSQTQTKLDFE